MLQNEKFAVIQSPNRQLFFIHVPFFLQKKNIYLFEKKFHSRKIEIKTLPFVFGVSPFFNAKGNYVSL